MTVEDGRAQPQVVDIGQRNPLNTLVLGGLGVKIK